MSRLVWILGYNRRDMLARRVLNTTALRKVASSNVKFGLGARAFSDEPLTIPTDKEQQGGRRKEELDAEERGEIGFDHRKSLVPPNDQGTKENPILVPSGMAYRTVGYENPATHQLVWFDLHKGPLHYIPDINLYFKLKAL